MPHGKSLTEPANNEQGAEANRSRPKFVSNHTHYSTTDRDSRISVKPGKPRQHNYSMQTAVDTSVHVITNIEAHHADKRDSECLSTMLTHTIENLKAHQLTVEEIAADTGYSSGKALQARPSHHCLHSQLRAVQGRQARLYFQPARCLEMLQ